MSEASKSNRRIRILFCEAGHRGGSVVRLRRFFDRLDRHRFEMGFIAFYRDLMASRLFEATGLYCRKSLGLRRDPQPDVFKHVLGHAVLTPFAVYYFLVALGLMRKHKPDLVYLNGGIGGHQPAIWAARLLGIKVICHIRITRPLDADEQRCVPWINHFVTLSRWAADHYARESKLPDGAVTPVYNGMELSLFDQQSREDLPPEHQLPAGPVYVCLAGTLAPRKRSMLALEAFELAARECESLKLVIAGDGPLRTRMESEVQRRQLQDRVVFLGHVRQLPALLQQCHIGLSVSEREGLASFVVMECMAASIPVVVGWLPGIEEQVTPEETACVVEEVSSERIAGELIRLVRSPELRRRMGEAGRKLIEETRFQVDGEIAAIEQVLIRASADLMDKNAALGIQRVSRDPSETRR